MIFRNLRFENEEDFSDFYNQKYKILSRLTEDIGRSGHIEVPSLPFYGDLKILLEGSDKYFITNLMVGNTNKSNSLLFKEIEKGKAELIGSDIFTQEITIPSKVYNDDHKMLTVVKIGDRAFYDSPTLINVVVPETVTSFGNKSFAYCRQLQSVGC